MKKSLVSSLMLSLAIVLGIISAVYALEGPSATMLATGSQFYNSTIQAKEFVYNVDDQVVISQTATLYGQGGYVFDPFEDVAFDQDSNLYRAVVGAYYSDVIMHALTPGEYGDFISYKGEWMDNEWIYCPYVTQSGDNNTNIDVMNRGGDTARFSIIFYDQGGTEVYSWNSPADLPPGESVRPDIEGLLPETAACAVISSTEDLIATVEIAGPGRSMAYAGVTYCDNVQYVPLLQDGTEDGWQSTIWAQNASYDPQDIQVDFYDENGSFVLSDVMTIAPAGVFESATASGAVCARVTGQARVAVAVTCTNGNSSYAYRSRGQGLLTILPLAMKNADGWNTSITVQNSFGMDGKAYLVYRDQYGNQVGDLSDPGDLPTNGAYTFNLETDDALSNTESFTGAVQVVAYPVTNGVILPKALPPQHVPMVVVHEKSGKKAAVYVGPDWPDKESKEFTEEQSWGTLHGFPTLYQYSYEVEEEESNPPLASKDSTWGEFCFVDTLKN